LAGVRAGTTEYFPSDGWLDVTSKNGPAPYEGLADRGDLVSQPCALEENGHTTWKFNMRLFTGASTQAAVLDELDAAIADHAEATEAWTAGFVAHETNFEETGPDNYEALFQRLANDGISLETLSQVALRYEYTGTGAPAGDLPEELACDTDD